MNPTPMEWALRYVEMHLAPIPLWNVQDCDDGKCSQAGNGKTCSSKGKHARVQYGDLERVTVDDVHRWWGQWPNAGIGILTGVRSGIDVIDVDPKNGGSIAALRERLPELPDVPTVWTGIDPATNQRGAHFWVRCPDVPTSNSLDTAIGLPGVDYRGHGGYVVAPPTQHYSGIHYEAAATPLVVSEYPAALAEAAAAAHRARTEAAEAAERVRRGLEANPASPPDDGEATAFGRKQAEKAKAEILAAGAGEPGGRHNTVYRKAHALGGLIPTGHLTHGYATSVLTSAAFAVVGSDRHDEMVRTIADGLDTGQARPWEPETTAPHVTTLEPPTGRSAVQLRQAVADAASTYLHLRHPAHLFAAAAVACTVSLGGDPPWLMYVAPPSSGKTETVASLAEVAHGRLDEVTVAGLLTWSRGKEPKPTGLLTRLPREALVMFGDLSTLIASSDRGQREEIFAALRVIFDGKFNRNIGPPGRVTVDDPTLAWQGRIVIVAAVTGVIDRYASHNSALGDRWLYWRMPERSTDEKRATQRMARVRDIAQHRDDLAAAMRDLVAYGRRHVHNVELSDTVEDAVEDAALVTAFGRASVPRHGYGRREIDGQAEVEGPSRLTQQLRSLAVGLAAIGLCDAYVIGVVRHVARSTMPADRAGVLEVLADGEPLTTSAVAERSGLHRHVARFALEELEVIGVIRSVRENGPEPLEGEPDRRAAQWRPHGEDGRIVCELFTSAGDVGWHEMWVPTPHPQI